MRSRVAWKPALIKSKRRRKKGWMTKGKGALRVGGASEVGWERKAMQRAQRRTAPRAATATETAAAAEHAERLHATKRKKEGRPTGNMVVGKERMGKRGGVYIRNPRKLEPGTQRTRLAVRR